MHKLAAVSILEKSISRGIRELQEKQLLSIVEKHYQGHRLANGYLIRPQGGRYTRFPVSALAAPISSCGFTTYAYIYKCADANRWAFPSLKGIAKAIGITVQTIIEQIKEMVTLKLLSKNNQIKKNNSFGHNLYNVFECLFKKEQKEKTRLARVSPQTVAEETSKCNISVRLRDFFVKGIFAILIFFTRGVLKFCPDKY